MSKELYFIDSGLGEKNNDNVTGGLDSNYFYHSYNFNYSLKFPLQNVSQITLKSIELPLGSSTPNNIRYNHDTVRLDIMYTISTFTNVSRNITVKPGAYSSIASLLTAINTAITTTVGLSGSPTINFTSITDSTTGFTHCSVTHNCTSLTIYPSTLTINLLGLGILNLTSSTTINGTGPINVFAIDNLYYIQITNIPVMNNNLFIPYTFKMPLNDIVNGTAYYNDSKEHQAIYFNSNSSFVMDKLNIVIRDRMGKTLTGYFNWTMTLQIEYDNNNTGIQEFLNLEY